MFFILDIFCPFNPLPPSNDLKSQNFRKKWKKCLEISSLYTSVPKLMIIGYTALEIWCMMNVIVFHFGQFFATRLPPPSPPLTAQKMKISKKMKKTPQDIIILHNSTKPHDHMLYCSWDMVHGYNSFSFGAIFALLLWCG